MKLWGGRFKNKINPIAEAFSASINFDKRLGLHDCRGSIAWTKALVRAGVLSPSEGRKTEIALKKISRMLGQEKLSFDGAEDIHTAVEQELFHQIGPLAGKLATGRSRNDQVSTDLRLYLINEIKELSALMSNLQRSLLDSAESNLDVIMPGFTHLQHAQPVLLPHHLMAYFEMIERDKERLAGCLKRVKILPLGSSALAGTSFPIDRHYLCALLGFDEPSANSMDAVSDRDYAIEFLSACAMAMMHLSRLSEELIIWSSPEFRFVELSDAFTTGSSIMPQKKNPDLAELIRGKTGKVYGNLLGLMTVMKGLPLAYNRDMQEDKEAVFSSADTLLHSLKIMALMLKQAKFNSKSMLNQAAADFSNATEVADYLVRHGLEFRTAHKITGQIILYCINKNIRFSGLTIAEWQRFSKIFEKDIYNAISLKQVLSSKQTFGSTAPSKVKSAIKKARKKIALALFIILMAVNTSSALNSNVGTSSADFLKIEPGARAAGLGGSYAGEANDATAIYWNPAGLPLLSNAEIRAMHLLWFAGSYYDYVAYAQPIRNIGTFAVSMQYFNSGAITGYSDTGIASSDFAVVDWCMSLGYAERISALGNGDLSAGINLKFIRETIDSTSGQSFAGDIGFLAVGWIEDIDLGLSVQNIGTKIKLSDQSNALPLNGRLGISIKVSPGVLSVIDLNIPADNNMRLSGGVEYLALDIFAFRIGYSFMFGVQDQYKSAWAGLTAGLGINIDRDSVNYTFAPYGNLGQAHRIEIGIKFGELPENSSSNNDDSIKNKFQLLKVQELNKGQ